MREMLIAILLLICCGTVYAEDTQTMATPDPISLSADWWTYLEPKEPLDADTFSQHITSLRKHLEDRLKTLDPPAKKRYADNLLRIINLLADYEKLKSGTTPESPLPATKEKYTLEEAISLFRDWRKLKQETEVAKEESDWQSTVVNEERKQLSRQRTEYLNLDKTSSSRMGTGLQLMTMRLRFELRRLEQERRSNQLRSDQKRLDHIHELLIDIPARLSITPEDIRYWKNEYEQAQSLLARLHKEPEESTLEISSEDTPKSRATSRYAILETIKGKINAAISEQVAYRKILVHALVTLFNEPAKSDINNARQKLADYEQNTGNIPQQKENWKRVNSRARKSVDELLLGTGKPEASLVAIQKKTLSLTGNIDQLLVKLDQEKATTEYVAELLQSRQHELEGWMKGSLKDIAEMLEKSWSVTSYALGATLFEINQTPVTTVGILRILLILTIAWWLSKGVRRGLQRIGEKRQNINQSSLYTLGRILHYLVIGIGIMIGLSSIGIDFTKFALFASALGVGIGFGLQNLISNFVAGLIILFERSLKVGDFVELESGVVGEVIEIDMRSTMITTNDNIDILVPNSEFVNGRVTNWTLREAFRRIRVPFGVAYGTDKDLVKKAGLEAADEIKWTLKGVKFRTPQVWFVGFGDSSLNFELVVWLTPEAVKRPSAVQAAYLWELETRLKKYDIEIPFPQRDLHVRSIFGKKDEDAAHLFDKDPGPGKSPSPSEKKLL